LPIFAELYSSSDYSDSAGISTDKKSESEECSAVETFGSTDTSFEESPCHVQKDFDFEDYKIEVSDCLWAISSELEIFTE
jgi:hypothetical protein